MMLPLIIKIKDRALVSLVHLSCVNVMLQVTGTYIFKSEGPLADL